MRKEGFKMRINPLYRSERRGHTSAVIQNRRRRLKSRSHPWLALGLLLAGIGPALGQPSITNQPQSCTNGVGTTATFTVTATGTEPLAYQWQKQDYLLNITDLAGCTNATLVLTNVQTSQAGYYRVVVTNADGAITSAVATLTVPLPPTNVKVIPANSSVSLGGNLTLRVTEGGSIPFSYQSVLQQCSAWGPDQQLVEPDQYSTGR